MTKQEEIREHHIWCNHFMRPVEGCEMCKRLNRDYPMDGLTPDELIKKHFPKAIPLRRNNAEA